MESGTLHRFTILAVAFAAGFLVSLGIAPASPLLENTPQATEGTVSVMLDFGGGRIETVTHIPWAEGETVFDVLTAAAREKEFTLESRDFGGDLGIFIETIDGIGKDPEGKKWWQFWVNGAYSMVGVSSSKTSPGDSIFFAYTGDQESE